MLEYFGYKKYKKNKAEKERQEKERQDKEPQNAKPEAPTAAAATTSSAPPAIPKPPTEAPILDDDDERFLMRLTAPADEDGGNNDDDVANRPPLPPRVKTPDIGWDSDDASVQHLKTKGKGKDTAGGGGNKKLNRLSIFRRKSKDTSKTKDNLDPTHLVVPEPETDREKDDLTRVLDDLDLSARNNKAFSLSTESAELVRKFTVVLKDLVNGVPTAANDLRSLLDDRDGTLARNFEKLPKSMKKLVTQLPTKLSGALGPEIMAVAAEANIIGADEAKGGGLKGAAKKLLVPKNLQDMITKPGAVVGLLRGIMNALKLRWPAFIGTNVIWSVAIFLLLFVLWYCHKRGREVRLEKERQGQAGGPVEAGDRIEELPDDPTLPAPPVRTAAASSSSSGGRTPIAVEGRSGGASPAPAGLAAPAAKESAGRRSPVAVGR